MSTERTWPPYALYLGHHEWRQAVAACWCRRYCRLRWTFCVLFYCTFRVNPHFDLEPDYITRKPIVRRIQRYILRREILSTFQTQVDHQSVRHSALYSPQTPLPLWRSSPKCNTHDTKPDPTQHPKQHPDPISHVATPHMCRQTDGKDECSITWALCSIESDALIIRKTNWRLAGKHVSDMTFSLLQVTI